MKRSLPFLKSNIQIRSMFQTALGLEMQAEGSSLTASCPDCCQSSASVHSSYKRTLKDLPAWGFPTFLILRVRKFFCQNDHCQRGIFAERFPSITKPYRRRTSRLETKIQRVALDIGGEGGARLLQVLGTPCSADTLLRITKKSLDPIYPEPEVVGVDDFAFRKGRTYGTVIVNLERHKVIDLLPDRKAETLKTWLVDHPSIRIISRDRAGAYALGSREGAPQARQVADRFHLLKNVSDALVRIVKRESHTIREAFDTIRPQDAAIPTIEKMTIPSPRTATPRLTPAQKRREEKRQEIKSLITDGLGIRAVARKLKITRATVRRYVNDEHIPVNVRGGKSSKADPEPYFEYLNLRWGQGCHNAAQLWKELRDQGYKGSAQTLRKYLQPWRLAQGPENRAKHRPKMPSTWRFAYLLRNWNVAMSPDENRLINCALEQNPALAEAAGLVRQFAILIKKKRSDLFPVWLRKMAGSKCKSLKNIAINMSGDKKAIMAAMELEWSNGQLEGQVNHIKVIKRQMYGRGRFALFRKRVLLAGNF